MRRAIGTSAAGTWNRGYVSSWQYRRSRGSDRRRYFGTMLRIRSLITCLIFVFEHQLNVYMTLLRRKRQMIVN
jgi:hypothetical protein